MSLATHGKIAETHGLKTRILMLAAPLAALIYPFTLKGFNASVTMITSAGANGGALPWITAAAISLLIAFAVPTIALLMAMSFAKITAPTAAEVRAKRVALLAVAAPTIFTFVGVVLYMLGDPIPDSWALVVFWAVVAVMVARADNKTLARTTVAPVLAGLRVAHGVSALAIVAIFLALHITNHLTGLAGPTTYDAVMKVFRHVYRTELLQPVLVALFFFQIATGSTCLAIYGSAVRPLPNLPNRLRRLLGILCSGAHELGLCLRPHLSRHRHGMGVRNRRAYRPRSGCLEYPARPPLRTRRVLRAFPHRSGSACCDAE